jgi:hypothetical protein
MSPTSEVFMFMHRCWCGTYRSLVRGDHAVGCQSFAPGAAGQMFSIVLPRVGSSALFGMIRPVSRSTPS